MIYSSHKIHFNSAFVLFILKGFHRRLDRLAASREFASDKKNPFDHPSRRKPGSVREKQGPAGGDKRASHIHMPPSPPPLPLSLYLSSCVLSRGYLIRFRRGVDSRFPNTAGKEGAVHRECWLSHRFSRVR